MREKGRNPLKKVLICMTIFIIVNCITILAEEERNVWNDEAILQTACQCLGEKNPEIVYRQNLYSIDEEVSAVFLKFKKGYMILGKCEEVYPVIEYGMTEAACFLEKAELKILKTYDNPENIKIYYFGGMEYYCMVESNHKFYYYDMNLEEQKNITREELEDIADSVEKIDYHTDEEWENLSTGAASGKSEVKNPNQYESSYYSKNQKFVSGYNKPTYFLMTKFTTVFGENSSSQIKNHCVPTTATNLLKYWYERNKTKYAPLKNKKWENTFKKLYKYMATNNKIGTYNKNIVSGYISFLKEVGVSFKTVSRSTYVSWKQMKQEIDNDYPFHLAIVSKENGGYYGDHSVLALGYVFYTYNSGNQYTYSRYMAIRDGWNKELRYVHVSNSVKCFEMIQLHLN